MRLLIFASALVALNPLAARADLLALPADIRVGNDITVNQTSGTGPSLNGTSIWDGVARIIFDTNQNGSYGSGDSGCSGTLLLNGFNILTAGHCVDDMIALATTAQVTFFGATTQTFVTSAALLFPGYTGAVTDPRDLGLLFLSSEVFGVSRYDIYRTPDEAGQVGTIAGYGHPGNGFGETSTNFGTRRQADNLIDAYWGFTGPFAGMTSLAYDFDAYGFSPSHDAFGTACFGVPMPQAGVPGEGMIAPGDSGGPFMIDGRIAGVHSWGGTAGPGCGDVDSAFNSSWGEVAGDARVSEFASWIDANVVPEPTSLLLLTTGLAGLALAVRRRGRNTAA